MLVGATVVELVLTFGFNLGRARNELEFVGEDRADSMVVADGSAVVVFLERLLDVLNFALVVEVGFTVVRLLVLLAVLHGPMQMRSGDLITIFSSGSKGVVLFMSTTPP